jgi:hypothetical protein
MPSPEVELIAFGDEVPDPSRLDFIELILNGLTRSIQRAGREWSDVSLLLVANSIWHSDPRRQEHLDREHLGVILKFARRNGWVPPLIGATTMSTFFSSYGEKKDEIKSGLLFVAFCSSTMRELPVAHVAQDFDRASVPYSAVQRAAQAAARARTKQGLSADEARIYRDSLAILLSTGSAHGDYSMKDDFRACYSAGVRLVELADETQLTLVGGHASNNRPSDDPKRVPQRQVLYYSTGGADDRVYERTDHFGAVCAFVPTSAPAFELGHPYEPGEDAGPLNVAWAAGADDRGSTRFLVESINDETVAEFLKRHWELDRDRLLLMADEETAIPTRPELHEITLLSAPTRNLIPRWWPNVPIWMERRTKAGIDIPLMRLVRGEDPDSFVFLVRLNRTLLERAPEPALKRLAAFGAGASSLSFLCESRRYVLESYNSNAEAWATLREVRDDATAVGIYVNGEHAAGFKTAIGYHNYSMVNVCFRPHDDQPDRQV